MPRDEWVHHEIKIEVPYSKDLQFTVGTGHENTESYIDNILVTSTHGPSKINHDGYNYLYKGFQILSLDYNGFKNASGNKQVFNFNS